MASFTKKRELKSVPWLSSCEWYQVYRQIYSNESMEQAKAYETMLIWKARMTKLPVGIDGTLSVLHVCLRDREWSPKINAGQLPMSYQNDLCLLYSTTIMRFLNHVSNIGHTKQTSMFQIARQLKIPEWIVHLRHDAAHGHELPSIDLFRITANILLTWLHDEYWALEAKELGKELFSPENNENDDEVIESLTNLIELWMAVGLYVAADYTSLADLPDEHLRDTLKYLKRSAKKSRRNFNAIEKKENDESNDYRLAKAKSYLLTEFYSLLSNKQVLLQASDIVLDVLFKSEVFLPTKQVLQLFLNKSKLKDWDKSQLPKAMIKFWQPFIALLHERSILGSLICRCIELVNSSDVNIESHEKKLYAALWLKSIAQGLLKLKIAQRELQVLEHSSNSGNKKVTSRGLESNIKRKVDDLHPRLKHGLWLNITSNIPEIIDITLVETLLRNPNELIMEFIIPFWELVNPKIESERKKKLVDVIAIYTNKKSFSSFDDRRSEHVYTVEDLIKLSGQRFSISNPDEEVNKAEEIEHVDLADKTERNDSWKLADESENINWESCEFGLLPWQRDLSLLESMDISPKILYSTSNTLNIIPGVVDWKNVITGSKIEWEKVLRKKHRCKRKRLNINADVVINKAIEIVKRSQIKQ